MEKCWSEQPQQRPTIKSIISQIAKFNGKESLSLVDNMVLRLEGYTKNLEDTVIARFVVKVSGAKWLITLYILVD